MNAKLMTRAGIDAIGVSIRALAIGSIVCLISPARSATPVAAGPSAAAPAAGTYTEYDPPGGFKPVTEFAQAPAGKYVLDPEHAHLTFQMLHYGGLSRPQIRFRRVTAEYLWDPQHPEATKIEARIQSSSIDGNDHDWEIRMNAPDVLRGYDAGENGKYRFITFESTSIKFTGKDAAGHHIGTMAGELTILGVTKPVVVNVVYNGYLQNRLGQQKMGFAATAAFKRSDFGMTAVPSAGDDVTVTMELEFLRAKEVK